jgi:hypothetical protein
MLSWLGDHREEGCAGVEGISSHIPERLFDTPPCLVPLGTEAGRITTLDPVEQLPVPGGLNDQVSLGGRANGNTPHSV